MHYFFTYWHGVLYLEGLIGSLQKSRQVIQMLSLVLFVRIVSWVLLGLLTPQMHEQNNCSELVSATSTSLTRWSLEMGPCLHHSILPSALGLQIITHCQAQLMRTFQCQLTAFLSKERKKKKRASGLGHRDLRHSEQSWWSLSPWLVWQCPLGSLWKAPPSHLGEEEGQVSTAAHLFFPLRKNSLRQASSSDTWLISDPHASLFFPVRCRGVSEWVGRGSRIGDANLSAVWLRSSPWGRMRSHIWELIPEGASAHHIQRTIADWGRRCVSEELSGHRP